MNRSHYTVLQLTVTLLVIAILLPNLAWAGKSLMRIPAKGPIVFEQLRQPGIEILAVDKYGYIDALVDEKQVGYVFSLGYPVSATPAHDPSLVAADLGAGFGMYHTYAETESLITTWETDFSSICDVFTIGTSIEGRPIYAIKISDNVSVDEVDETEVLYMSNIHAREVMSNEMTLLFAEHLLLNYGSDPTITAHVEGKEIFFVPIINPDGRVYVDENHTGDSDYWWRKNRRINSDLSLGVDLNRNFGYAWGYDDLGSSPTPSSATYRGESAFSEPESQVIRDFVNGREFTMWLSYHSYGELLLYPWGYVADNPPDHKVFAKLGELLTATNGYLAGNYATGAIYSVNGDTDDWAYGEQGTKDKIFAFTPELNSGAEGGFGPSDTLIAPTFALNLEMNMLVLEYCANPYSVVGPYRPTMYAIDDFNYPSHTVRWSSADPVDPNPTLHYDVERCLDPDLVLDPAEALSTDWDFDGFTLGSTAHSGSAGYYSGSGDYMSHNITTARPYLVDAQTDSFTFWASYTIELDWDYAYVEVSEDLGETWTPIEGNITTTYDPYGNNRGHGITGSSSGWVEAIFPLTAYLGQELFVRVSYITDASVMEHGIDVDDLYPVPTCAGVDIIASAVTDTVLQVAPDQIGTHRYRVQAIDAESDASGWSGSKTIDIIVTDAASPLIFRSRLGQNYPNPFNPVTRIPYTVGGGVSGGPAAQVTLRVYDVAGRLLSTLVNEVKSPGAYETSWNGTSGNGTAVSSGIYFYRLTVDNEAAITRKLLLLK